MAVAVHPCPRCGALIPVGITYCAECKPLAEAQAAEAIEHRQAIKKAKYDRRYNRRRDPKYMEFYRSKEWRLLSRVHLQARGYHCEAQLEGCTRLAVEVHHRRPIQTDDGWARRLDPENLEAVCINCHNKRHERFKRQTESGVVDLKRVAEELKN